MARPYDGLPRCCVVDPILSRHHRIEGLSVEVAIVDLVPLCTQDLDDLCVQGRGETRLDRMGEQHQDAQRAAQFCAARARASRPGKRKFLPAEKSKSGFSQAIILPGLSSPRGSVSRLNASWIASVCFMPPSSRV